MKIKCLLFLLVLCGAAAASEPLRTIPYPPQQTLAGPAAVDPASISHSHSPYFAAPDIFSLTSGRTLTVLSHYPTYQQTTEYTCGPAAALTVFYYLGETSYTEAYLAQVMKTKPYPVGSNTKDMAAGIRALGWKADTSLEHPPLATYTAFRFFVLSQLQEGRPILVENVEWGGHWRVIIGYDTMGTSSDLDDTLLFADPYDVSDHAMDGYATGNGQRFYAMWFDHAMLPEGQRNQPWIVIYKK